MSNEQFTDALAAKSAQLHVGLDMSVRFAFELGAMWAKEVLDPAQPKATRPFRPGQLVKWVQPDGIKPGIVRKVGRNDGREASIVVDFQDSQEEFWADGRSSSYDSAPSLFHID